MRIGTRQRTVDEHVDQTPPPTALTPPEPPSGLAPLPPPPPTVDSRADAGTGTGVDGAAAQPRQADPSVHRTRAAQFWSGVVIGAVVLLALLIFVLENGKKVDVAYFGFHGHLPLGVLVLFGAIAGALLVGLASAARILQLRLAERRVRREQAA